MKTGKFLLASGIIALFTGGLTFAATLNVGELDLDFCNGSNKLHLDMDAETSTGICMNLKNLSSKDGLVSLGFVDGEMSQGEQPVQACKTSAEGTFGKGITLSGATTFEIKGGETIRKEGKLTIPKGIAGNLYGCVAYMVLDSNGSGGDGQMFTIISRKANTISVTVSGQVISQVALIDGIQLTRNGDGVYTITMKLKNIGTANEQTIGMIHVDDNLLFSKDIQFANNTQLYPAEEKEFKVELGKLPRYGGKYTITATVNHTPVDIEGKVVGSPGKIEESISHEFGILKYGLLPLLGVIFGVLVVLFFIERPFAKRRRAKKAARRLARKEQKRIEKEEKLAARRKHN